MGKDYIPQSDADFDIFQDNFIAGVQPNLGDWDIPNAEFSALQDLQTAWNDAWAKAKNKDTRSRADVQAKNDARDTYESGLRKFVKEWLAYNSKVSDAERESLGLTVRDTQPTPSPVPDRAPDITLDEIRHLSHTLRLTDPANPHTQAKPKGVREIEVFRYIVPQKTEPKPPEPQPKNEPSSSPPTDIDQYRFVGNATRFLYTVEYTLEDVGKTVWYIARYVNTRGESGPWSEPFSATVA